MDVTFTNVLEGARQYFQGLPTATPAAADSPFYRHQQPSLQHQQHHSSSNQQQQVTSQQHPTNQQQNQLISNQQSNQQSSQHLLNQQPHSNQHSQQPHSNQHSQQAHSNQHSQHSSQHSNQPQYQLNQQYQSSHQYASQQQSNQQLQYRQHGSPYQSQSSTNSAGPPTPQSSWADQNRPPTRERTPIQRPSSHSSDGSRPPSHHSQQYQSQESPRQYPTAYQKESPQPMSQTLQQSFNFSQPQSRESTYRSQVPTSLPQYHPSQLGRSSSKEQLAQQSYQYSAGYPSKSQAQYGYTQSSYYPQADSQVKNSSYNKPSTSEPYPASTQRLNPYLQVTNNDRFSQPQQQRYPTENIRTQVSSNQPAYSHTHNLPPIAALSSYHSSRTNNQSKEATSISYTRDVSSSYAKPVSSSSSIIKPNQNPISYSQEQRINVGQSQSYYPNYTQTSTITTNAYSSVIMTNISSSNTKSNQPGASYYHGPNKAFLKNAEGYQINKPSNVESKNVPVIKENPLDLSVKTVKTTADSTLQENESVSKAYQAQKSNSNSTNHTYPTFDMQKNLSQITHPPIVGAPKVDFQPRFNIPPVNNVSERQNIPSNSIFQTPTPSGIYNSPYGQPEVSRITPHVNQNSYQYGNVPQQRNYGAEQKNNLPRPYQYPEVNKKRHAEVTSSVIPEKVPKVETWRQSIDLQIEQKLSSYKQENMQQHSPKANPTTLVNGNYPTISARDIYNFNQQREQYKTPQPPKSIPYSTPQANHTQTYVPSPSAHRYPDYNHLPKHVNNQYLNPYAAAINPMLPPQIGNKQQIPGGVDRKTLNLLRNSIETKEQKKIGQMKSQENLPLHPRPEIQHSNTDVTAPLQPKLGVVGRNNVSPFTPTSFPETNMASMYKFNPQKPPTTGLLNNHQTQLKDIIKLEENNTVIVNNTHPPNDYDGLAAFLAARIRTKGELKQVGPNNTAARNARVQMYVNEQIKSPPPPLSESPLAQNSLLNSTKSSSESVSPPKLAKETSPRKRLFSKTEEEQSNNNLPLRDKSGIRSSSETSVFDFDDDDDNQMPVLKRQSLEAMRRDRRSSLKQTNVPLIEDIKKEIKEVVENLPPPSRTPSPIDEVFASICDNFVDYLKNGPKKRGGRKKKLSVETPIKVEPGSEDKLENVDFTTVEIKKELIDEEINNTTENNNRIESSTNTTITPHKIGILSDSDLSDSDTKKDERLAVRNKNRVRRKILSSSESSEDDQEKEKVPSTNVKVEKTEDKKDEMVVEKETSESKDFQLIKPTDIKQEKVDPPVENQPAETTEVKEEPIKKLDTLTVIRPAKKPLFGTGSEFCQPGWEEEVFRYKKSLRMPSSLIQVTRPPNSRLSTSLPDLDPPCPPSPTPSITSSMVTDSEASKDCTNKKIIKKFKSEPMDSDSESTTSFNIFSKKTNYDSEDSSSSLPNVKKEKTSILDKLLEKCGGRKKRKYNRKDDHSPKVIPKSENNLLPTPGFEASEKESPVKDKKIQGPIVPEKSALLNFRKVTINNFKDAFIKSNNTVIHNKFATVVLTSRTRKETKALQQRATIKEVFGAERPASAPPCEVTAMNNVSIKDEVLENTEFSVKLKELALQKESEIINEIKLEDKDNVKKDDSLLDDKEIKQEILDDSDGERKLIEFVIKRDPDAKYETTSLDSEEGLINKRRNKFGKLRRKFSSGFDYIRKKKKIKKETNTNTETPDTPCAEKKKRLSNKTLESVDDLQKEIKTWVLNKGIGEAHLHRAARLGYTDITAYCLEKMDCHPSPKDNAGYTPLHEACSRGHLQIAKLLLMYGANVHESAQGGIRPLHMAVENGYVEIVRLLLSYGADPSLGTYAGMTPINLANDEDTKDLLLHHLADRGADRGPPWHFRGPASCFDDPDDLGYNMFDSPPKMDSDPELDDIEFEISESMLPNLYTIRGESPCDKWVLLQDLSSYLKVKSRDTLLRQLSPDNKGGVDAKSLIRELKMTDFLDQARCCQFLNQGEKLNTRANKIALVKFTDRVKELLGIEMVSVSR